MNILKLKYEKIERLKAEIAELEQWFSDQEGVIQTLELYFDDYELDEKPVDELIKDFERVFELDESVDKDIFLEIAYKKGYRKIQVNKNGKRFYTLRAKAD